MSSALAALKTILVPHYVGNIVLAVIYFILKTLPPVCEFLFEDCNLELKEWEWLTFLGCVLVLKNRKQATFTAYISTSCLFAKVLSGFLFFRTNALYGILYGVFCLLHFIFLPEPVYSGPEDVVYFRGPNLEDEIKRDRRVTWLITFYAAWSPPCVTFSNVFSELSSEYSLDNFKFGKIDVSRYPDVGTKFRIDGSSFSKQLPTLMLFEDGKETMRKPFISPKGTIVRYAFSKENVIKDFELNKLYSECKKNPLKTRKDQEKEKKEN